MKSRTSFFNSTVLRKDITRFAPLWGLYTVFTLMFIFLIWSNDESPARFANNADTIMRSMGLVNLIYGALCAAVLFRDLFSARLCNALHAMPLRREGWFLTHLSAGLLFCLVPNTVAALVSAALLRQYYWLAFVWLGLMVLQFLFFFGVGVFACVSAGNRLGAAAIYGLINFFALLVAWLILSFYEPFLYGIQLNLDEFVYLSPIMQFSQASYVNISYQKNPQELLLFNGFFTAQWIFAYIVAAVGVLFLVLAVLVYRKRKLETAGDLISLPMMRPVFVVAYTLCAGAALYSICNLFSSAGRYVFLVLGLAIGFFTGRMLLERRVHVFRGKNFLAFAVFMAVFGATIGLTWLDPVGVTRYVPELEEIESVSVSQNSSYYYLRDDARVKMTQPEDLQTITAMHRDMVVNRRQEADSVVYIHYDLKNGRQVDRKYYVETTGKNGQTLKNYYSSMEYVLGGYDLDTLLKNATSLEFYSHQEDIPIFAVGMSELYMNPDVYLDKYNNQKSVAYLVKDLPDGAEAEGLDVQIVRGLFEAMQADCELGIMAQSWNYHPNHDNVGSVVLQFYIPEEKETINNLDQMRGLDITLWSDCVNTIAYLKSLAE